MMIHLRSALSVVVVVTAVALCSRTTSAFLFPTASYASALSPSTRLASSYYDDMDYTAQRNQVQERYVHVLERRREVRESAGWDTSWLKVSLVILLSQLLLLPTRPSQRPDWAGEGVVSSLVSALINNKFLYGFMKIGARKVKRFGGGSGRKRKEVESRTRTWLP